MDVMDEAVALADEISEKIKNSTIYKDYHKAYLKIKNNAELVEKLNKLKTEHLEYADFRSRGMEDFDREKYISQEFYKAMLNEDVRVYFMNEDKLVNLIADIYSRVSEKWYLNLFV